jgi:hypothetical protein
MRQPVPTHAHAMPGYIPNKLQLATFCSPDAQRVNIIRVLKSEGILEIQGPMHILFPPYFCPHVSSSVLIRAFL